MASTAMLALVTAGAFSIAEAQDEATEQPAVIEQPTTEQPAATEDETAGTTATAAGSDTIVAGEADATLTPDEPTIATAFIGTSVYSSEDPESDNIGEVNDLIIGDNGMITHAVVGVGGFLGIGEKDVAVPFEELQVVEQDGDIRLIYAATKEQLEAAEEFDRTAYDPRARAAEEQALQDQAAAPDSGLATAPLEPAAPAEDMAAAPAEEPATDAEAPAEDLATAPAEEPATDAEAPAEDMAAAPAEEPATDAEAPAEDLAAAPAEEPATDAEAPAEDLAAAPAEEPATDAEAPAEDMAAAPAEEPATDAEAPAEDLAAAPAEEPATDAEATAEEQVAASTEADTGMTAEGGFVTFSADQVRASTLIGQEVFGPDDQSIGEISDLVLQEEGDTRAAIIDVGGFLGVGEKEVAIPFDQLEVSADGEETRVTVALSQEELEQLPAFEAREDVAATEQTDATAEQTDVAATEATAEQPAADAGEGAAMTGSGFEPVTQDLSAEELIGAPVIGSDEENIGEVGDVVFDPEGSIEAVVVDVGGFLGMGEKPVALQFDSLSVQQDEGGDLQLMVNATQEQLEGAEAYQETAAQ
jgi:sporulation protein YlmC with PRC-barrel domain